MSVTCVLRLEMFLLSCQNENVTSTNISIDLSLKCCIEETFGYTFGLSSSDYLLFEEIRVKDTEWGNSNLTQYCMCHTLKKM